MTPQECPVCAQLARHCRKHLDEAERRERIAGAADLERERAGQLVAKAERELGLGEEPS